MSRIGALSMAVSAASARAAAPARAEARPRDPAVTLDLRGSPAGLAPAQQARLDRAMAPMLQALDPAERGSLVAGLHGQLAARRAQGQDSIVIGIAYPGGTVTASVLSPEALNEALFSDDPLSLGRVIDGEGKAHNVRDLLRKAMGLADPGQEGAVAWKQDMTAMLAAMLAGEPVIPERAEAGSLSLVSVTARGIVSASQASLA
ncbi:hypothetical protein BKE38_19420 [Pseudoroseomonas deserti]|uniref:Uncharacterized protein n=1 Tax=Teichococcus deserti TaxID=1817963 RepID=A0A1V2GYH3_9PROT|nr:hypothetical protein [Pseudoroseomonas deserti]ONG50115.1 hypothetical protein BKE38_19420 [Pseudoroseomonas deserti]